MSHWKRILRPVVYLALFGTAIFGLTRVKQAQLAAETFTPKPPGWEQVSNSQPIQEALERDDAEGLRSVLREVPLGSLSRATATLLAKDSTEKVLGVVLDSGFDANGKSKDGAPISYAITHGQIKALRVLLEHGANPNLAPQGSASALCCAVGRHGVSLDAAKLLLDHGARLDIASKIAGPFMGTPLEVASKAENVDAVRLLLDRGADAKAFSLKNLRRTGGRWLRRATPEQKQAKAEILAMLVAHGADPSDLLNPNPSITKAPGRSTPQ